MTKVCSVALISLVLAMMPACAKKAGETESKSAPVSLEGEVNNHGSRDISGVEAGGTLTLEQDDFYFEPTFIKASPGAAVKIRITNEGSVQHNFSISSAGLSVDETVEPGSKVESTVNLPVSGAIAFFCKFHRSSGMQGAFYFREGDTVVGGAGPSPASSEGYRY